MATRAVPEERPWLSDDLWLSPERQEAVAIATPGVGDASRSERGSYDRVELGFSLLIFLPQLAWIGFLLYLAFQLLS